MPRLHVFTDPQQQQQQQAGQSSAPHTCAFLRFAMKRHSAVRSRLLQRPSSRFGPLPLSLVGTHPLSYHATAAMPASSASSSLASIPEFALAPVGQQQQGEAGEGGKKKEKKKKGKREKQFTSSLAKLVDKFIRKVDLVFAFRDDDDVRLCSEPADLAALAAFFNQFRDLMAFCNGLPIKPLVFAASDSPQRTRTLQLKAFAVCHMTRRHCFRILGSKPSLRSPAASSSSSPPPASTTRT